MNILEALKKSFITDVDTTPLSNEPDIVKNKSLSDDPFQGTFVINASETQDYDYNFSDSDKFSHQNSIIQNYRHLAADIEVSNGIDIIVNQIIWTIDKNIFKISIDESNEKIKEKINQKFKKVLSLINIKDNIYNLVRNMYIDGQLNVSLAYDPKDKSKGIVSANIIEPFGLYFETKSELWKYNKDSYSNYGQTLYNTTSLPGEEFTESELVRVDYGLYSKVSKENELAYNVNLSYLEGVEASANLLKTLENMLVPLRYSRSVSRRLFNIDISDLPPKQAKELMNQIRAEFKYKKSYDPATGSIKNIKNTQPLVEDYWMSNRSGNKGTTVETMDEKGSIMDLDDIRHAANKLYTSLKLPPEFNPYSEDQPTFSFDDTEISQSLLKFYIFISRLRTPITKLIKEILRRELVATNTFQDSEWKAFEEKIDVEFTAESVFLESASKEMFLKNLEGFVNIKESIGEVISLEKAVEQTFGWSTEQLSDELKKIEEEKKNPMFKAFYERDAEADGDPAW